MEAEQFAVVTAGILGGFNRSEWWISPMGNRRLRIAIFSASSHRTLFSRSDIDQPTISIVARSLTAAR